MVNWTFPYLRRGQPGYEEARKKAVWNGRVPDRYPEIIAFPKCDDHVVQAVRHANETRMTIGIKSGGHSWTASFLREGGMLLDMEQMKGIQFDVQERTAVVETGAYGSDLNDLLRPHGLMFPSGHCPTVGIGGFLLQGGFGWNSRKWGIGCQSVMAIDLVNSAGELLHADANENSDYYWAARGAGCGYFSVITRWYLQLYTLPKRIMTSRYILPVSCLDQLMVQAEEIAPKLPRSLEMSAFIGHDQDGFSEKTIALCGDALSDSEAESLQGLKMLDDLPVIKNTLLSSRFVRCTLPDMLKRFDELLDNRGRRYEADNIWTDTPAADLVPHLKHVVDSLPPAPSHLYILWWEPSPIKKLANMAFSLESKLWMSLYAIGDNPADDKKHADYVVDSIRSMDQFSKGIQLADENLVGHPAKFMATENYKRLEALRRKYDPYGRFYSYMRVPLEYEKIQQKL
ncbi:hypothetical protein B7463_g10899, partial [Scytalidium lignicola]